jgi:thiamine-monophosphate kinase
MPGADTEELDEFEFIREVLRPLTRGAREALQLEDDVAIIAESGERDLVVTTDAMVEGVHFLASDPPDLVARKLLRVNLSDLAAKGAEPYAYLLVACWPRDYPAEARRLFVQGLETDQAHYGLRLFGGDTVSTPGPLTLSVTMMGRAPRGCAVLRKGAVHGDRLLVTGTIGDGWLGLKALEGELDAMPAEHLDYLADRYRLPQPRLELAMALRLHAKAAADVSDGLVADAGHIAAASGQGVRVDLERLPLSAAAREWVDRQLGRDDALAALATGGDDYEIVCAAPPAAAKALIAAAEGLGVRLTDVGEFSREPGLRVASHGAPVEVAATGWRHG